jgi:hypothetical protein
LSDALLRGTDLSACHDLNERPGHPAP